ncbi:hypothetical protein CFC21_097762 [Triticum aestivum]|uniref:Secreted protein n=4 Tax=Triticum TaxID=4564 RepID=A0A9R0ZBE6_TRITD|nr:hypothetical protein TRIUR3_03843 [Triticum urartu]KAF7095646.1 hypothetical protein CFC21_097762 [Triticum aestivum]VAI74798.1 unnamed protein product [Triticum turgidum subsp. durum]
MGNPPSPHSCFSVILLYMTVTCSEMNENHCLLGMAGRSKEMRAPRHNQDLPNRIGAGNQFGRATRYNSRIELSTKLLEPTKTFLTKLMRNKGSCFLTL